MINRYIKGFNNFKCIASKCPASCCSGWTIEIDETSLNRYSECNDDNIKNNVNFEDESFYQKDNLDCAFLRNDGLCQMIIDHGEEMLCDTCNIYPRHIEEFPNIREYTLSLSCPVVAEELLKMKDFISFESEEKTSEIEELYDFDYCLYERLFDYRNDFLYTMEEFDEEFYKECEELINIGDIIQKQYDGIKDDGIILLDNTVFNTSHIFSIFKELEPLNDSFRKFIEEAEAFYSEKTDKEILDLEKKFVDRFPDTYHDLKNILRYFVITYMCGAVYDEYIYSMTSLAAYSARMILLLWIFSCHTEDKRAEILYKYSRELEHSNENMIKLEQLIDAYWR